MICTNNFSKYVVLFLFLQVQILCICFPWNACGDEIIEPRKIVHLQSSHLMKAQIRPIKLPMGLML